MPHARGKARLSDFTDEGLIVPDLEAAEKPHVLSILVHVLASQGCLSNPDHLLAELEERERDMSTGIGDGVAIPHVRSAHVRRHCVAIGISRHGVPFDAVDGQPVFFLFLVAAPLATGEFQVHLVSTIARLVRQTDVLDRFRALHTPREFLEALRAVEQDTAI
jgi:mannitol/fructose-specific phosphotransferase system IIA component (Ntr-type)